MAPQLLVRYESSPSLILLLFPLSESVGQSTTNHVDQSQTHRRTAHNTPNTELLHKRLATASCKKQIQTGPRRAHAGSVGLEALQVRIAGEEQGGREEHRKELEGFHVLCGDQGGEQCGWE